jgi:lipopolysaccharide/colanic/teichoic acid biosynthesis glycosyltransferase
MNSTGVSGTAVLVGQVALLISVNFFFGFVGSSAPAATDLLVLLVSWAGSVLFTFKHRPKFYQKRIKYIAAPFFKAALIMIMIVCFFQMIFNFDPAQRKALLVSTVFYTLIELFILVVWCSRLQTQENEPGDVLSALFASRKYAQADLPLANYSGAADPPDLKALFEKYRVDQSGEFSEFIEANLARNNGCKGNAAVHSSCESVPGAGNFGFILCTMSLNMMRNINGYLSASYGQLLNGGWLVLKYTDAETAMEEWRRRFGRILSYPFCAYQFLFHRALPKFPGMKEPYLALTKGRNRVMSSVEVWGRLAYCGFDVLCEKAMGGENYIIARKTKTPSDNPNPSYYPIITLDRVGLYGQIIKIHKIRTMYPYSEFLQKKVFEENRLSGTGKFNDDYRITRAGRVMRKYYLDELPQFIDWLRGEIKLVGIRAMSLHFFSLYPREYQELFLQVKPGILSPVFDEGTVDFSQIVETESRYLKSYPKNPVLTDISYFFRAMHQTIFHGTLSK